MSLPKTVQALQRLLAAVAAIAVSSCEVPSPTFHTADLVISVDGAYTLAGKPVAEKDLLQELRAVRERAPSTMLNIRTDRGSAPPAAEIVRKAAEEAGFVSLNYTTYKEQADATRTRRLIRDSLFWGTIQLVAILLCAPFVLRAKTPSAAMLNGFVGVLAAGILIATLVGVFMDFRDSSRPGLAGWAWGMNVLFMLIYGVPSSLVAGMLAGVLFWLRVRLRSKPA